MSFSPSTLLRGHVLLFDRRPAPDHGSRSGASLLVAAVISEAVRIGAVRWLYPTLPLWLLLPLLLALALFLVRALAGLELSRIGLLRWSEWSAVEKAYLVQVVVLANVVFPLVFGARLARLGWTGIGSEFVPYLFFGFYQEVVYRGMVQRELVRRWGAAAGILVANVLYTFGPLHWGYFRSSAGTALPMFAAIFVMGLFFGVLYRRSGNLWLPAIFHAIGNAYMVAGTGSQRF